jgi:hypothetical protein
MERIGARSVWAAVGLWALSWGVPAMAQQLASRGGESRANTTTAGNQQTPAVSAAGATGGFVVVWRGVGEILGQRFLADGTPNGAEFRINTTTAGTQQMPSVAAVGTSGAFVVVWTSPDADGNGILGQRFLTDGTPDGSQFQVNTYTTGAQTDASVAGVGTGGEFVVVWTSTGQDNADGLNGVYGQRYLADGTPNGTEFLVNTYTTSNQQAPAVSAIGNVGAFVVVWQSNLQDGASWGVYGQRFLPDGTPNGGEFRVNTRTASAQQSPSVASIGAAGEFVAAWQSNTQDGSLNGVYGQRYLADGTPNGTEFRANTYTLDNQRNVSVSSAGPAGEFVVTWQSVAQDPEPSDGVYARWYHSDGTPEGNDFRVNSYTTDIQNSPVAAKVNPSGDFVVAWQSNLQDGSQYGIYVQQYLVGTVTVTAPTSTTDVWAVDSTQRIRWEHDLGETVTFDVQLSRDGGTGFSPIATDILSSTPSAGNYNYTVTDDAGSYPESAVVRVSTHVDPSVPATPGLGITDDSVTFTIEQTPTIDIRKPRIGVPIGGVNPFTIVWTQNLGYRSKMMIEFDPDGTFGDGDTVLVTSLTYSQWINRGQFSWDWTGRTCDAAGTCMLRVSWVDDTSVSDDSDSFSLP